MRIEAYSKKGKMNVGDNSNTYLVKKNTGALVLGYGDSARDRTMIENGVIAVFEGTDNGDRKAQTAYIAAKELGVSYVWSDFIERNVRAISSKIQGQAMAAVVYVDEINVVTALNVGNVTILLLRDGNVEELSRTNSCIMGSSGKLNCKTSFRKIRTGDVLLVLNSGMFEVLYDDILKAAKLNKAKEKVVYLNIRINVYEQMEDFMNDSTIVMAYEG